MSDEEGVHKQRWKLESWRKDYYTSRGQCLEFQSEVRAACHANAIHVLTIRLKYFSKFDLKPACAASSFHEDFNFGGEEVRTDWVVQCKMKCAVCWKLGNEARFRQPRNVFIHTSHIDG